VNSVFDEGNELSERLILWDIDGTLLKARRQGGLPLHLEVARNLGSKLSTIPFESAGLTDSDIIEQLLSLSGNNCDSGALKIALHELDELSVQSDLTTIFEVLPGVVEALEYMKSNSWDIGVLTGNTFRRAMSKIEKIELTGFISQKFIFTCNPGESREDIAKRAHSVLQNFDVQKTTIIGDTPADIFVARQVGYNAISVATGKFDLENLARHKPDLLLKNFHSSLTKVAEFFNSQGN
jgi:phosphoglycolate phosphatase-like HAD superfamily hydrolase